MEYLIVKTLHILSSTFLFGTGSTATTTPRATRPRPPSFSLAKT